MGAAEPPAEVRRYRVHARHEDVRHGRIIEEASFEAAALAYAEHLPLPPVGHDTLRLSVHELDSGHEHSFVLRVDDGEITLPE